MGPNNIKYLCTVDDVSNEVNKVQGKLELESKFNEEIIDIHKAVKVKQKQLRKVDGNSEMHNSLKYLHDTELEFTEDLNNINLSNKKIINILDAITQKLTQLRNKVSNLARLETNDLKFIDLFAGIGGFHQALNNLNFECVMASEINEKCHATYIKNYKMTPRGDITKISIDSIPQFDILCGGFPCQPFSKAGAQNGFKDSRGNLFFDICKIIKQHNPKYIILENVRNLATHDKGNTWKVIKDTIKKLNYNTYETPLIINTLYFGIPQSRERVVIMCKRKDLGELQDLPKPPKKQHSIKLIDIIENKAHTKYNISPKLKQTETVWNNFIKILRDNKIDIPKYPIWTDWWDSDGENTTVSKEDKTKTKEENKKLITKKQKAFYKKYTNWIDKNRAFYKKHNHLLKEWLINSRVDNVLWSGAVRKMEWQAGDEYLTMNEVLWSPRGSGVRVKNLNYSPTLVAMASMIPIYGPQSRQLTPRECARLQSFPENFIIDADDNQAYKQFGNAVNVTMIEKCAGFLINKTSLY